jgi:hypothetical protein
MICYVFDEILINLMSICITSGIHTAEVAVDFANRCALDLPIFRTINCILRGELAVEV